MTSQEYFWMISVSLSFIALVVTVWSSIKQSKSIEKTQENKFKLDTLVYATAQFDRLATMHAREEMSKTGTKSIKDYLSSPSIDSDEKKKAEQQFMEYVYTFNRLGAGIYCGSLDRRTIFNIWPPSFFVARWKKFETFVRDKQTENPKSYRFFEWLADECLDLECQYPEAKRLKVLSSPASK